MKRDSYIFYRSFYDAINKLTEHQQLVLYRAITVYSLEGDETEFEDNVLEAMFSLIKPQLTANNNRYANGKKGGRPRQNQYETNEKPNKNQSKIKQKPNENVNVNVNENVNVNDINICVNAENADKSATHTKTLDERRNEFYKKLIPYVERYGKEMIRSFYNYWSQVNEGGKKMLCEMQKAFEISRRLETWSSKEYSKKTSETNDNKLYRNQTKEDFEQAKTKKLI